MKKRTGIILGVLIACCLIYTALITAVEAVCYWTPGYFEKEYEKYDVLESLPPMTMSEEDGLMAVTRHMMKYLRGDQDAPKLQIEVEMGGVRRGFFTEREILHMEDVRALFVGAQRLRVAAIALMAALLFFLWTADRKAAKRAPAAGKRALPDPLFGSSLAKGMLIGTGVFLLLCIGLGAVIASDFSGAFITFHHIFFDNDLWILDPSKDMLVNIVPEGFFFDTASHILFLFGGSLLVCCALSAAYLLSAHRRQIKRG